jgi:hypothetical protein
VPLFLLVLVEVREVFAPEPVMTDQPFLLGSRDFGLLDFKCLQRPEKPGRGHGVEGIEQGGQTGEPIGGRQSPPPALPEEYVMAFFPHHGMFPGEAALECIHNALPVVRDTADEVKIGSVVGGEHFDRDLAIHPGSVKGMIEQSGLYAHGILPVVVTL